jgi:hypothetical protein
MHRPRLPTTTALGFLTIALCAGCSPSERNFGSAGGGQGAGAGHGGAGGASGRASAGIAPHRRRADLARRGALVRREDGRRAVLLGIRHRRADRQWGIVADDLSEVRRPERAPALILRARGPARAGRLRGCDVHVDAIARPGARGWRCRRTWSIVSSPPIGRREAPRAAPTSRWPPKRRSSPCGSP